MEYFEFRMKPLTVPIVGQVLYFKELKEVLYFKEVLFILSWSYIILKNSCIFYSSHIIYQRSIIVRIGAPYKANMYELAHTNFYTT